MTVDLVDRTVEVLAEYRPCKTPGCPNEANRRYDRGVYAGLCEEACIPRRRKQISADNSVSALKRDDRVVETPLADLAAAVVPAARELDKKLGRKRDANAEAKAAFDEFKATLDALTDGARRILGGT